MGNTKIYDAGEIQDALIEETLRDVIEILKERGYNPVDQIVGYLMSGDPGYISSHKEARTKITQFDRTEIFEFLIKKYCE